MQSSRELATLVLVFGSSLIAASACGHSGKSGGGGTTTDAGGSGGSSSNGTGGSGAASSTGSGASGGSSNGSGGSANGSGGSANGTGGTATTGAGGEAGAGVDQGAAGAAGSPMLDPVCEGTATTCDSFDDGDACAAQMGCSVGTCTGDTGCEDAVTPVACADMGCEWVMPCQPLVPCDTHKAAAACNKQDNCQWDDDAAECVLADTNGCTGTLNADDCNVLDGCVWAAENFACMGEASSCGSLAASECTAQEGCSEL